MKLQEKFALIRENRQAILATNFYNFETLYGVLMAAKKTNSPIILQLTESSINYIGLYIAVKMARAAVKDFGVEAWLHLDHGNSYELVQKCLDAGFDSVMIDASEQAFKENIKLTQRVVQLAEKYGVNVEAELGYVAKLGQSVEKTGFTQPHEAKEFVEATGINALAVAIGSAHGFYKKTPELQLELLSEIQEATDVFLVLHGSSGIPHQILQQSIERGMVKVNLATEIKNIFMKTLKDTLQKTDEIDLRKVFPISTNAIVELVAEKLEVVKGVQTKHY